jgi:phosphoribosyl-AMP cyclohydrolase
MRVAGIDEIDFAKGNGLVPVVTQEYETGKVLMVAYANREAVELTLKTRSATYWTRSRQKIWVKGEESGHVQKVRDVLIDCDGDTLVYVVEQTGPACHTGSQTCFYRTLDANAGTHTWGSIDEGKKAG